MKKRPGKTQRSLVLKVSQPCVFCDGTIKKGQSAIYFKVVGAFEHPRCREKSEGYLGEDGILERGKLGYPRCHLCGWYQVRLDLHIVSEHGIEDCDYRTYFSINSDEKLVGFTESAFDKSLKGDPHQSNDDGIFSAENLSEVSFASSSNLVDITDLKHRTKRQLKQDNPKNTRRKKKGRHGKRRN